MSQSLNVGCENSRHMWLMFLHNQHAGIGSLLAAKHQEMILKHLILAIETTAAQTHNNYDAKCSEPGACAP